MIVSPILDTTESCGKGPQAWCSLLAMAYMFREYLRTELMFAVRIVQFLMDDMLSRTSVRIRCDSDQLERKEAEVRV